MQFGSTYTPDPCNGTGYNGGETEDYSVNVITSLPVELTNFSAACNDQKLSLNWNTTSEKNNLGFEIQESDDGNEWQKIDWQPTQSSGNSNVPLAYQHEISRPSLQYLRLKQIDEDLEFSFSPVISNPCFKNRGTEFLVYPNPLINWLTIDNITDNLSNATFQIFNQTGQLISEQALVNLSTKWNSESLPNGVYIYRILNNSRRIQQGKFVKAN